MDVKYSFMPADLIRLILLYVHNNQDAGSLTSCQCVDKMWYYEGRAIRWAHVSVYIKNLRRFFDTLTSLESTDCDPLGLINSLTLRQSPSSPIAGSSLMDGSELEDLAYLEEWLPKMPRLQTFSYNDFSYQLPADDDFTLWEHHTKVLRSIRYLGVCRAIENLEISNVKALGIRYPDHLHMCLAIRQILPNLRRLRYVGQPCCYMMYEDLDVICPKLEEIIIDVGSNDLSWHCGLGESFMSAGSRPSAMDTLTVMASKVVERGLMPKISHFVICGMVNDKQYKNQRYDNRDRDEHTFAGFYRVDILKRRTTVFPTFVGNTISSDALQRFRMTRRRGLNGDWMLYKDPKTGQTHDLVGGLQDFLALVQERNWSESLNKVRVPAQEARRITDLRWSEPLPLEQLISNGEQMRSKRRVQTRLWFLQDRLKKRLVEVKEHEGLVYPEMPSRERIADDWVYFDEVNYMDRDILAWAMF